MKRRPLFNAALFLFLIAPLSIKTLLMEYSLLYGLNLNADALYWTAMVGVLIITLTYLSNYGRTA